MTRRTAPAVRPGQGTLSHDAFVCEIRWGIDLEGVDPLQRSRAQMMTDTHHFRVVSDPAVRCI
jgi:hypothetical protein